MKKTHFVIVLVLLLSGILFAQEKPVFEDYFVDKTMRVDYFRIGDAKEETVTIDQVYEQGIWAGSKHNLIDSLNYGRYCIKIYDASSGKLIFSKGFDSYFGEYKTTGKALKEIKRSYHESFLLPYPKRTIQFSFEARDRKNVLHSLFKQEINPSSVDILKERLDDDVMVFELWKGGDPHVKVDLAFIAEGYTREEEPKLKADLQRFMEVFFKQEPYKSLKNEFNLYGVFKPSQESGCDEPRHGVFKNTVVNATFNSLGSERYLLTEDNKSLRDIAAHVPYDTLVIMVNQDRYGGGGIYNLFCTFTVDNQWHEYLFVHEFGHSFSGLADEYYTSSVAYNEFYPQGIEPMEPNITALLDPQNLKWNKFITPGIAIPTPWEKEEFDRMDNEYQKIRHQINEKIAQMKREGAPKEEIQKAEAESERLSKHHADKMDAYLEQSAFTGKVGAFEGAGYSSQGLYRPMLDCLMFSKGAKPYCLVCEQAIIKVIKQYTQ
ncbi:MAG: M64 family metallopeptidase [Candidatus Aminicenantaceae bacterium]|jgi:hypothetical protein